MKHKRILTPLVTLMLSVILAGIGGGNPLHASASGVDNIIARADYWYSITWTAQRDVNGWRDESVYKKGETYHLPYGQPMSAGKYLFYGIPVESLIEASRDPSSEFYTQRSLNAANGNAVAFTMWDKATAPAAADVTDGQVYYLLVDCPAINAKAQSGQMWQATKSDNTVTWKEYAGEIYAK